jgi:hypothetical protein
VIPEPRTGRVSTRRTLAARTVQEKRHESIETIPVLRLTRRDAMNVIEPPSLERPRTCRARIARETLEEELKVPSDSGQYIVQPAEIPSSRDMASTMSRAAVTRA